MKVLNEKKKVNRLGICYLSEVEHVTVVYTTYGLCHSVFSLSVSFSPQLVGLFENWAHLKYLFFSHGAYHRALQMLYTQLWWSNKWMIEWLPKETCLSNYWLFTYSTNIVSFLCVEHCCRCLWYTRKTKILSSSCFTFQQGEIDDKLFLIGGPGKSVVSSKRRED